MAPGKLRLLLALRKLPPHGRAVLGLRLSPVLAQRLWDPRPRPHPPLPVRRLLGLAVAALRRPPGLRRNGRSAEQIGLLQLLPRGDHLSHTAGLGSAPAHAL